MTHHPQPRDRAAVPDTTRRRSRGDGFPVSVVISTRDRPRALARCLRALRAGASVPTDVVVVDQSRDEETRRLTSKEWRPLRIRYLRDEGVGMARSQNLGFAAAEGRVIAVTDDDCVPAASWVRTIRDAFRTEPELGLLTGPVLPLGPVGEGRYPVATRTSTVPRAFRSDMPPWEVGSGNNFAVRTRWVARVGGNDVRLGPGAVGLGAADMDLFRRLLRAGVTGRYEPGLVVRHQTVDRPQRLARRYPYGFGMGAACLLWLRQGDRRAAGLALRWCGMRLRRLIRGAASRDGGRVREEVLVLLGTAGGLWRAVLEGWRGGPSPFGGGASGAEP